MKIQQGNSIASRFFQFVEAKAWTHQNFGNAAIMGFLLPGIVVDERDMDNVKILRGREMIQALKFAAMTGNRADQRVITETPIQVTFIKDASDLEVRALLDIHNGLKDG